jgi:hypothetical protein
MRRRPLSVVAGCAVLSVATAALALWSQAEFVTVRAQVPLSAGQWARRDPATTPPARGDHAMVYDSDRGVIVMFGGWNGHATLNDTWEWNGQDWRSVTFGPGDCVPGPRYGHGMVYDKARKRVVLFGGIPAERDYQNVYGDTWEYDGVRWVEVTPAAPGPSPRFGHGMVYDAKRRVTVMSSCFGWCGDVWEWDGTTWGQVPTGGSLPARSTPRLIFDEARQKVLFTGGYEQSGEWIDDLWQYETPVWNRIAPDLQPLRREYSFVVFDGDASRAVWFGGVDIWSPEPWKNDTWSWDSQVDPPALREVLTSTVPSPRKQSSSPGAVWDEARHEVVLFGGEIPTYPYVSDETWTFAGNVNDTTPPDITVPGPLVVDAASASGAVVTFSVTAVDAVSGRVTPSCDHPSGTLFPIGVTSVTCSASDAAGNTATGSFTITVQAGVIVELRDSQGLPISGGVAHYYSGGWLPFGTTGADGRVRLPITLKTYTFRMTYEGGVQDISQNTAANTLVAFRTSNVVVQLNDGGGGPLDTGSIQYYAGTWRPFGTTTGGRATRELLPAAYTFRMSYAGGVQDKAQNVATNPVVTFQTVVAIVSLEDSGGSPLDTGTVQYYAGAWRSFGTTSGGRASRELLPLSYMFRMTYAGGVQDKVQALSSSTLVSFTTAAVHSDSGTCSGYYAGAWRTFVQDMEMLPATYVFRFSGTPDSPYVVTAGGLNHIR